MTPPIRSLLAVAVALSLAAVGRSGSTPATHGPHTIHRLDLNNDRYVDYVVLEGEEDYFRSTVLLATGPTQSPADSGLRIAYEQIVPPYVAIVDPDHDGRPEIVASSTFGPLRECEEYGEGPSVDDSIEASAAREYFRLVGTYDTLNFTYGGMKQYPLFNLALDRVVRILRAEGGQLRDVSNQFPAHRRWRRAAVETWASSLYSDTAAPRPWMSAAQRKEENEFLTVCARGLESLAKAMR